MPTLGIEPRSCALQAPAWTTIARSAYWLRRVESNHRDAAYEAARETVPHRTMFVLPRSHHLGAEGPVTAERALRENDEICVVATVEHPSLAGSPCVGRQGGSERK